MEGPPAAEEVFATVTPIVEEVEQEEVGEEGEPRSVLEGGEEIFEVGGDDVAEAEGGVEGVDGGLEDDEEKYGEDAESGEESVEDVDAGGGMVRPAFDGEEGFERAEQGPEEGDLDGPQEEQFGPLVSEFGPGHEFIAKQEGLEERRVEPGMQFREKFNH